MERKWRVVDIEIFSPGLSPFELGSCGDVDCMTSIEDAHTDNNALEIIWNAYT